MRDVCNDGIEVVADTETGGIDAGHIYRVYERVGSLLAQSAYVHENWA